MNPSRRRRRSALLAEGEADPLAHVANLFDASVVFIAALLVAWAAREESRLANETVPEEQILDRFVETGARRAGNGERLGTAYRLEDGRIVYVPE